MKPGYGCERHFHSVVESVVLETDQTMPGFAFAYHYHSAVEMVVVGADHAQPLQTRKSKSNRALVCENIDEG